MNYNKKKRNKLKTRKNKIIKLINLFPSQKIKRKFYVIELITSSELNYKIFCQFNSRLLTTIENIKILI